MRFKEPKAYKKVPKDTQPVSIRLDADSLAVLDKAATAAGMARAELIQGLVREYVAFLVKQSEK